MYKTGDQITFRDWNGSLKTGTITEIEYGQICVDVDDTDHWIIENEIVNTSVL